MLPAAGQEAEEGLHVGLGLGGGGLVLVEVEADLHVRHLLDGEETLRLMATGRWASGHRRDGEGGRERGAAIAL